MRASVRPRALSQEGKVKRGEKERERYCSKSKGSCVSPVKECLRSFAAHSDPPLVTEARRWRGLVGTTSCKDPKRDGSIVLIAAARPG